MRALIATVTVTVTVTVRRSTVTPIALDAAVEFQGASEQIQFVQIAATARFVLRVPGSVTATVTATVTVLRPEA